MHDEWNGDEHWIRDEWFENNSKKHTYFATEADRGSIEQWADLPGTEVVRSCLAVNSLTDALMWAIENQKNIYKEGLLYWRNPWIRS